MNRKAETIPAPAPRTAALSAYRTALASGIRVRLRNRGPLVGATTGDGDPPALAEAVLRAECAPDRIMKRSAINLVFRARIDGRDMMIKRYDSRGSAHRATYWTRPSRGRRAWAAATALQRIGIPTPRPIGFIEDRQFGFPGTSYAVVEYLENAAPARRWIKAWLHQRPAPFRDAFRSQLLGTMMTLYENRIYHGDTKTSNLLLQYPEDPDRRTLYWIDLDCMQFGVRPTRRRVLRNLVQLNGSLGSKLADEDRLAFLDALSGRFPWAGDPRVADRIRTKTMERLQRELRGECGP